MLDLKSLQTRSLRTSGFFCRMQFLSIKCRGLSIELASSSTRKNGQLEVRKKMTFQLMFEDSREMIAEDFTPPTRYYLAGMDFILVVIVSQRLMTIHSEKVRSYFMPSLGKFLQKLEEVTTRISRDHASPKVRIIHRY